MKGPTEAQIHGSIVDYLNKAAPKGMIWHHSPNEGRRGFITQRWLKTAGTQKGWPDLEIFYCDHVLFLEVKSAKGKTSIEQEGIHNALVNAGCHVFTVRSLEEAQKILASFAKMARQPTGERL